ncbi:hypothetical protein LTS10_005986 [Elasticomyces elasticus]|nr:hypothetical protein LTS10_005986 [Elasticomyces elasticus]
MPLPLRPSMLSLRRLGRSRATHLRYFSSSLRARKADIFPESWAGVALQRRAKLVINNIEQPYDGLTTDINRKVQHVPQATSLTPTGQLLRDKLTKKDSDPSAILKGHIEEGTANAETIRLCFEEYYARISKHPRKVRREMMQHDQIAGLTLQWLWQEDFRWASIMQQDMVLFDSLIYYLAAENLDHFVLGWIKSDLPSGATPLAYKSVENRWRGTLLRGLINAHLMLEVRPTADTALGVYFGVLDDIFAERNSVRKMGKQTTGFTNTSFWPGQVLLSNALGTGRYPDTNPELYQRFIRLMEKQTKKADTALSVAKLHLHHPGGPDPDPMWVLLQQHLGGKTHDEMLKQFMASGTRARVHMLFAMRETERLLRSQDRTSDAQWVLDKQRELLAGADEETRDLYRFHEAGPEGSWKRRREEKARPAPGGSDMISRPTFRTYRV